MININQSLYLPMMKTPICCPFSHREIYKMCASQICKVCPFICKFCKNNLCLNQHTHNGGPTLTFLWSDIEEMMKELMSSNGFYLPEVEEVNKAVEALVTRVRSTVEHILNSVRRLKSKAMMKVEFRKTVEKFKNSPENLTGAEMGRLLDAARKSELLENKEEIGNMVKGKFGRINTLLEDLNKRLEEEKDDENDRFRQLLRAGEQQRKNKNYKEAITNYTEALTIEPSSDLAFFCRGYVYDQMRDYNKAIEQYTKAIELNKNNSSYYNNRGIVLKNLNRFNQAIQDYTKAINLNDNHADYYFNRAIAEKGLNEYSKAEEDFNKAIQLSPNSSEYYNGRGVYWKAQKKFQEALEDYTKAISINPLKDDYYSNRGIAYATLKQNQKALDDFNRAIDLNPQDSMHYRNRAVIYDKLNRKAQAAVDRLKSKQLDPKS